MTCLSLYINLVVNGETFSHPTMLPELGLFGSLRWTRMVPDVSESHSESERERDLVK